MSQPFKVNIEEENDLRQILAPIKRHYYLFIIGVIVAMCIAYLRNKFAVPIYQITSSVRIIKNPQQQNMGDYINSSLFGDNQNLQDELLVLKSAPVIAQTIKNLDLPVSYFQKSRFKYIDAYKNVPFKVLYRKNHIQPMEVRFHVSFSNDSSFQINAEGKNVAFYNFEEDKYYYFRKEWNCQLKGVTGRLIETSELSFIIAIDSTNRILLNDEKNYYFQLTSIPVLTQVLKSQLTFNVVDINANAIEINLKATSLQKGVDILNSLTSVYSNKNLEKKNHLAAVTISYIDKQIGEISDSLNQTEQKLQLFRSSNQLLNVTEQTAGITTQYRDLGNQRAELVTKKKYYEYVSNYLANNDDFTNVIVPSSIGIQDQLLNTLIGELIASQAQKSNLVENNQEKNPAVKKLSIKIENLKKTISENIQYVLKTTDLTLDELNKRIAKIEAEISRMPNTERQLTGIERKFRLNDAIYNYLMEKRAEANITRASNLPDNEILEPAAGWGPVIPNKKKNYTIAFIFGLIVPFVFLQVKNMFNNKIETQDQIERITDIPVLGKIPHNHKKNSNVVYEYSNSSISEAYRALRTNLEYYVRGGHKKVIMVTSSIEGEGKSFNALNIAMCYAQLNRSTILIDFDLRKPSSYFNGRNDYSVGLTSYLINKEPYDCIIFKSMHEKLHYIPSGPLPPNPVELIALEKTQNLINHLKGIYDYIIIDSPPLAQVTDSYLLLEYADVKIIITRFNFTLKNVFTNVVKDLGNKNIGNVCVVMNDNRVYSEQYGYGYGYRNKIKV